MNGILDELATRLRGETIDLERTVRRIASGWQRVQEAPDDQDFFLDSVALNLHGFYSAVERLFELVARHIDGQTPGGETWHRDLLGAMARDVSGIRPAIISTDSAQRLDRLRRFRHLVRNVYATNLVPERMADLIRDLNLLWPTLHQELLSFAEFLEQAAREESDTG
ncbi:MAG: antitoxin [Chloroflexia bacterium]